MSGGIRCRRSLLRSRHWLSRLTKRILAHCWGIEMTIVLHLSDALLDQVIYALIVRKRELNKRTDVDSELIVQTQAALDLVYEAKELKARSER